MTNRWKLKLNSAREKALARVARSHRDARPVERIDPVLGTMVVGGLLAASLCGYVLASWLDSSDVADPALLRPLPDDRILSNLRDSKSPFIGASETAAGSVVMLREDGYMARLDPTTGLVRDDRIPAGALDTPAVALAAACQVGDRADKDAPACFDDDVIHVLSEGGGLLRGTPGLTGATSWSVLLNDRPWIGATGSRVEQAEVTSWASSASGADLAVLAGPQGLAVLDNASGGWIVPEGQTPLLDAHEAGPIRLVPDGETIWVVSHRGYGRISNGTLQWSSDRTLILHDLAISPEGERYAIVEGTCRSSDAPDCLTLSQLEDLDNLRPIVGETDRLAELEQSGLRHAMMQGDIVVVLGATGVHAYDGGQRAWKQVLPGRIDAWHAQSNGRLVVASSDTIALIEDAEVARRKTVEGAPFRQVVLAGEFAIGLGRDGLLRDLESGVVLRGGEDKLPSGTAFTTGAAFGTLAILVGPDGVLIHDVAERRFQWISNQEIVGTAEPLLDADARLITIDQHLFVVNERTGEIHTGVLAGSHPNRKLTTEDLYKVRGPLRSMTQSEEMAWLVDADGAPWELDSKGAVSRGIGLPKSDQERNFSMVTGDASVLTFGTDQRIWTYDTARRSWSAPLDAPDGEQFLDLAQENSLFAVTSSGKVVERSGTAWRSVLDGRAAAFDNRALTDAAARDDDVLLAGNGKVQSYDPVAGAFGPVWTGGNGAVRLVDPGGTGDAPVWTAGGQLLHGSETLLQRGVRAAWQVSDGYLAEVRDPGGLRYTAHYSAIPGRPTCTFLTAPAPTGTVRDGVKLAHDRVLVATDSGWGIHDPVDHRWIQVEAPVLRSNERLVLTPHFLLALSDTGFRAVPQSELESPDSCAAARLKPEWVEVPNAIAVAYDPVVNRVAILQENGQISTWVEGLVTSVGLPEKTAPSGTALRAATRVGSALVAADSDRSWRYNIDRRQWESTLFSYPDGVEAADVTSIAFGVPRADSVTLTAWLSDGRSLKGELEPDSTRVTFLVMGQADLPRIPLPPDDILDFSASNGIWAVGSETTIAFGKRDAPQLAQQLQIDPGFAPAPFDWGPLTVFLRGDQPAPEAYALRPGAFNPTEMSGSLSELTYRYAPGSDRAHALSSDGNSLVRIDAEGSLYRCILTPGIAAPDGCSEVLSAPLKISADDLDKSWRLPNSETLLASQGRLLRVDQNFRNPMPLPGPEAGAESILFRDLRIFQESQEGALWALDDTSARKIAESVTKVRRISAGLLVAADGEERLLDLQGQVIPPPFPQGSHAITFGWYGETALAAIGPDGSILTNRGPLFVGLIPKRPETIRAVLPANGDGAWIQRDNGVLDLVVSTNCDAGPHAAVARACLASDLAKPISDRGMGRLLGVASAPSRRSLIYLEGGSIMIEADGTVVDIRDPAPDEVASQTERDNTADVRARIVVSSHGSELAPAEIKGRQLNGEEALADEPRRWPALSLGWMNWKRDTRQMVFQGADGDWTVPVADAIVDRTLLPARSGRAVATPQGHAILTPEALWAYQSSNFSPNFVSTHNGAALEGQADEQFLLPSGQSLEALDGTISNVSDTTELVFGDLTLSVARRKQEVRAEIARDGAAAAQAFAARGFRHDTRRGLAWLDGQLFSATDVGFVPAAGPLQRVEPLPWPTPPPSVLSDSRGAAHLLNSSGWLRREAPGRWSASAHPLLPYQFADAAGRSWILTAQGLDITSTDTWRLARNGLAFEEDRFISVAGTPSGVALITGLGTHRLTQAADLRQLSNAVASAAPAPLDALPVTGKGPMIFDGAQSPRIWETTSGTWAPPGTDRPWERRIALETTALRITLAQNGNSFDRRVIDGGGTDRWASFNWSVGEAMPFDWATSVALEGDTLWIGTAFGLRKFDTRSGSSATLFDAASTGDVQSIERIGRPETAPTRLVALTPASACLSLTATSANVGCQPGDSLERRFVTADSLWSWVETNSGIEGTYLIQGGANLTAQLTSGNAWPHDDLASWARCGSRVDLWRGGMILRDGTATHLLPAGEAAALHCQLKPTVAEGGATLPEGLYLTGSVALQEIGPGNWAPLAAPLATEIALRSQGRIAFEAARLRIVTGPAVGSWQHRTMANQWRPLDWLDGQPALDTTMGFAVSGERLMRVTPAGVVAERRHGLGARLEPATLLMENLDSFDGLADCTPVKVEIADGGTQAVPASVGDPMRIWCDDGRALIEQPGKHDLGGFAEGEKSIFTNRELVTERGWTWTSTQSAPSAPELLSATLNGEPMRIVSGRFAMDIFQSLAAPFTDRLEIVSQDGWRRHEDKRLRAGSGERPIVLEDASKVTNVTMDRLETESGALGDVVLCTQSGTRARLHNSNAPLQDSDTCRRWQGRDRFWRYRDLLGAPPLATAQAANGPGMERDIAAGQFSDLVAIGLPRALADGLLVPTRIGALQMSEDGVLRSYFRYDDMRGLVPDGTLTPQALHSGTLTPVFERSEVACDNITGLAALSADWSMPSIQRNDNTLQTTLRHRDGRQFKAATLDCATGQLEPQRISVGVADRARYRAQLANQGEVTGLLRLEDMGETHLRLSDGLGRSTVLRAPAGTGPLLTMLPATGERTILALFRNEVLALDIDAGISALARETPALASHDPAPETEPEPKPEPTPTQGAAIGSTKSATPEPELAIQERALLPSKFSEEVQANSTPVLLTQLSRTQLREIQQSLAQLGFYRMSLDGIAGPGTEAAIRAFQRTHGWPEADVLTRDQIDKLQEITSP